MFKQSLSRQAATPKKAKTANGGDTFASTTSPTVDLFFQIAASRGKDITGLFEKALLDSPEATLRMLFWARDIRHGSGERDTFRKLMLHLEKNHNKLANALVKLIPEYGRWDDLLIFNDVRTKKTAYDFIKATLNGSSSSKFLCAKWLPRKGKIARELREHLGLSPKDYRKLLVHNTKVVETLMCSKNWNEIDFSHVPSVASSRYQKAFNKNAPDKYAEYKEALTSKDPVVRATAKVNAKAIFPHDVLKPIALGNGDVEVAKAQWEALPNYLGDDRILPMCDVSGSMGSWNYYGYGGASKGVVDPIDISISLGLYLADKQEGGFKDIVLTFSSSPELEVLEGDIVQKIKQINRMNWSMGTNIERAFQEVLDHAVNNNIPADEMPKMLLILSDMEFNSCVSGTAYASVSAQYANAGYTLPRVVFWNLNGREGNNPVTFKTDGTALVSGYSPHILKAILSGNLEEFTPEFVMKATVFDKRYDAVGKAVKELI
jgi:hypothetical protein